MMSVIKISFLTLMSFSIPVFKINEKNNLELRKNGKKNPNPIRGILI